mgnify:CR=1 FL=1
MPDAILSESLMESNAASKTLRDPFEQARNAYESKQVGKDMVLSSTPFSNSSNTAIDQKKPESIGNAFSPNSFKQSLMKMGIPETGISFNGLGKIQLIGRLKQKFGDQYQSNPDAMEALKAFDANLANNTDEDRKAQNEALANANRTIGAIFGGVT